MRRRLHQADFGLKKWLDNSSDERKKHLEKFGRIYKDKGANVKVKVRFQLLNKQEVLRNFESSVILTSFYFSAAKSIIIFNPMRFPF